MKKINGKIIYAATPFRFSGELIEKICDFIEQTGNFPLHPLLTMPLKRYNYQRYSKDLIYKVCFGMVDLSEEVWIFGIGSGSLKEYQRARNMGKQVRSFVKRFDPNWEEWSQKRKYQKKYGDLVREILEESK